MNIIYMKKLSFNIFYLSIFKILRFQKSYLTALMFVFSFTSNSYARFAKLEDADIKYDFYNRDISINADGTHEETIEFQITLLREQARGMAAKFPIPYNADCESIDVIEAKSIFKGTAYQVTNNLITDKEVESNQQGFDRYKQISISFPKSEVGSSIYLKYKKHSNNVPIKQEFFTEGYYGTNAYWEKSKFTINSKIALKIKVSDPEKKLSINIEPIKNKPDYFYKAQINLVKPLIKYTVNEVSASRLNSNKITYFSITSIDNWQRLGNALSLQYEEVLNQKLPKSFSAISETASKEKNIVDQVNKVTTMLNEQIEYFSNWQSVKGRFVPQDLKLVAKKQSGDCKDFATITVKILKSLGYKANVALVYRGAGVQPEPDILATLYEFNHAIVRVIDTSGKEYWIDPTNSISMADGLFSDVAEKYALVLNKEKSEYKQIPAISEHHAQVLITDTIQPNEVLFSTIKLLGEQATQLTGAHLYLSKQSTEDLVYNGFTSGVIDNSNRINTTIPSLKSRIVTPINIELQYTHPNLFSKTNLGRAYSLATNVRILYDIIKVDTQEDVNDLYLSHPRTLEKKTTIKNIKIEKLQNLNFTFNNQFISLSRQVHIKGDDSIIIEKAIIHKSWIKNHEFKSEDFNKLQLVIKDKVLNNLVVLPN